MAGKPKPMSQIKQLLQRHKQEKAKKEITRILGISKNPLAAKKISCPTKSPCWGYSLRKVSNQNRIAN